MLRKKFGKDAPKPTTPNTSVYQSLTQTPNLTKPSITPKVDLSKIQKQTVTVDRVAELVTNKVSISLFIQDK